jgi:hypothetical protein
MMSKRQLAALWTVSILTTVCIAADDLNVQQDPRADLSMFKTFGLRGGTIKSERPELDNPLFANKVSRSIRTALIARGLTEATGSPDLLVDFTITGADISTTERTAVRGVGPRSVRSTEATLVIDLKRPGTASSVWRGVYRDDEKTGSKLVRKLPEDAKKLIDRFPRHTR